MSRQAIQAINFLKKRQEISDLRYWLALVNYDPEERDLSSRAYRVYLIVFFSIWFFMVLIFLAGRFLRFLPLFGPLPIKTVVSLGMLLTFTAFNLINLISSSLRSPLVFSEEDRYLLCQQPLPARPLVFRSILVPWLKNFLLFGFIALMLGFVLGEVTFPSSEMGPYFFHYLWYGLRAAFLALPFHMASYAAVWALGIFTTSKRGKWFAWIPTLLAIILLLTILASLLLPILFGVSPPLLNPLSRFSAIILFSFFGQGNFSFGLTFLLGVGFFILSMLGLWFSSPQFSASRAAAETEKTAQIGSLLRYAQFDAIKQIQKERRLKLIARIRFTPDWQNGKAFLWKALIQFTRTLSFGDLWHLLLSLSLALSFSYVGNSVVAWFGIASWIWLLSKSSLGLLESDLRIWQLSHQISYPFRKWLFIEAFLPLIPHLFSLTVGLLWGERLFKSNPLQFLPVLFIGLLAAQLQLVCDLLRKNQAESLVYGSVREVGLRGLVMAVLCLVLPLLIMMLPGLPLSFLPASLTALALLWYGFQSILKQIKSFSSPQKSPLSLF